jgi:hypothetical protein
MDGEPAMVAQGRNACFTIAGLRRIYLRLDICLLSEAAGR